MLVGSARAGLGLQGCNGLGCPGLLEKVMLGMSWSWCGGLLLSGMLKTNFFQSMRIHALFEPPGP